MSRVRALQLALAALAVALPIWPLVGLVWGALEPAPVLFPGQSGPQWAELLVTPGGDPGPFLVSLGLALAVGCLALPVGSALAWAEQRGAYPGARALGIATLLPLAIPSYVLAGTIRHAFGPGGAIGSALGLPAFVGFGAAVVVLALTTIPYVQLLVGSALSRCPVDEEEAARTLGAGPLRVFRSTVLPRLRPAWAFSLLLVQLYVVSDFGAVAVLDCRVLTWRLFQAVSAARFDSALQLGVGVIALTLPLLIAARLVHGRGVAAGTSNPRPAERRSLGGAGTGALLGLQLLVVAVGVAIPVLTLVGWIADGLRRDLPFASITQPLIDTAWIAALGAVITTGLAVCPAWIATRGTRRQRWVIEQGTYLTSGLPGVLLAFGLMLAALHGSRALLGDGGYASLLGSGVLLFAGFGTRFLAEAFASLKAGMALLDRRLEESAQVLGAGPGRRAQRVIGPQLAPALAVAAVLTFLAIVKELPVTLLLGGPLGLRPLSFRVYDRYTEALNHDAGLAAVLIVAMGAVAFVVSLRWRQHV